jgi:hypothetical protein
MRHKWGHDYQAKLTAARRAAAELGLTDDHIERLFAASGPEAVLERLAEKGQLAVATSPLPQTVAEMDPAQALHRISELKADPAFMSRYMANEPIAKGQLTALFDQAYPEAPAGGEGEGPAAA